jgi:hypothetical protein
MLLPLTASDVAAGLNQFAKKAGLYHLLFAGYG